MENNDQKIEYLGDGVYAVFDGYGVELRANDHKNPTDVIYLEPLVLGCLFNFAKRMEKEKEKEKE